MEQDPFVQREKLVQAHQLGELQKDYTIRFGKQITPYVVGTLLGAIIFFVLYASTDITTATIGIIGGIAFYWMVLGGLLYSLRGLHVYVYTDGLIYWCRKKRKAVRWEQIRRIYRLGDWVTIEVKNEPSFGLSAFIDQQSELYATIKRQVDSHRSAGTELELSELINPELLTPAWRMKRLTQACDPGVLIGKKDRVYFITLSGEVLFQADKQDVKAKWPWWELRGGVRLTVGGKVYRIHFRPPSYAKTGPDWSDLEADVVGLDIIPLEIRVLVLPLMAYGVYHDIKKARRNAKAWREYLGT